MLNYFNQLHCCTNSIDISKINIYKRGLNISRNKKLTSPLPINNRYLELDYLNEAKDGCMGSYFRLIILVKSAPEHFLQREVIRKTWGNPRRFSDVLIKTVFLVGLFKDKNVVVSSLKSSENVEMSLEEAVQNEITAHDDILRANYLDTYDNSTYKMMSGFKWLVDTCADFRFALIADDDMYISVKNVLKFVRNPSEYPEYWEKQKEKDAQREREFRPRLNNILNNLPSDFDLEKDKDDEMMHKNSPIDFDIDISPAVKLYTGKVYFTSPHRSRLGNVCYYSYLLVINYNILTVFLM